MAAFLFLSLSLSCAFPFLLLSLSLSLSLSVSVSVSFFLFPSPSLFHTHPPSLCVCVCLSLSLSFNRPLSLCYFLHLSLSLSLAPSPPSLSFLRGIYSITWLCSHRQAVDILEKLFCIVPALSNQAAMECLLHGDRRLINFLQCHVVLHRAEFHNKEEFGHVHQTPSSRWRRSWHRRSDRIGSDKIGSANTKELLYVLLLSSEWVIAGPAEWAVKCNITINCLKKKISTQYHTVPDNITRVTLIVPDKITWSVTCIPARS